MNKQWRNEGVLPSHASTGSEIASDNFCLAIMGPGGTGKTAVLRMIEALTVFFAGADTVQKLAPSNAAARLLGGDTLHALCKLPFWANYSRHETRTTSKTSIKAAPATMGKSNPGFLR